MVFLFCPDFTPAAFRLGLEGKAFALNYRRQLEKLVITGRMKFVLDSLPDGAALLCFEADHNDCHRSQLAKFLTENNLAVVKEFEVPPPVKSQPPVSQ